MQREQAIRVVVGSADGSWAGAVAAALSGAGFDVDAIVSAPERVSSSDDRVTVLAFTGDSLRAGVSRAAGGGPVLALGPDEPELMLELLEAGALGYLPADTGFPEIVSAVEQLVQGHAVVAPSSLGTLLRRVVQRRRAAGADLDRLAGLSAREREILSLVARGADNSAIAERLFISPATARTHLQKVYRKLDVHSRAEAVAFAARCGLVGEGGSNDRLE